MPRPVSPLYTHKTEGLSRRFTEAIDRGLRRSSEKTIQLFFRADDIGVPSHMFFRMTETFETYDTPLCLALVPAWLSRRRWRSLTGSGRVSSLVCWHQHGWRHTNHERQGKKQEFGESRREEDILDDLRKGRDRLAEILGAAFVPVFTPPWNRCGKTTLKSLKKLGFQGISRNIEASPPAPAGLVDMPVNVDLHTRREPNRDIALHHLLLEIEEAAASGRMGIMLHHQRMNDHALVMLEKLLQVAAAFQELEKIDFRELIR